MFLWMTGDDVPLEDRVDVPQDDRGVDVPQDDKGLNGADVNRQIPPTTPAEVSALPPQIPSEVSTALRGHIR